MLPMALLHIYIFFSCEKNRAGSQQMAALINYASQPFCSDHCQASLHSRDDTILAENMRFAVTLLPSFQQKFVQWHGKPCENLTHFSTSVLYMAVVGFIKLTGKKK